MAKALILTAFIFLGGRLFSQNFTSYFTGNPVDAETIPLGGICLMGGGTENDEAMKWFLSNASGGDILVLRASGSNGYNNYMYSSLGITVNSVETIVFNNSNASFEPYVHDKIKKAEAIWIAGGNQWNYVSYWRNTPIDSLINIAIAERKIVIGGTSAGMAIMGKYYYTAQNGSVTSSAALANPYNSAVTVESTPFLSNVLLQDVVTDTHFDNPDRKGRLIAFLARVLKDEGFTAKGIACDEYTAVCIDSVGLARVFGNYPTFDDNAYFIQPNCELNDLVPETCSANTPLTWSLGNNSLRVYKVKGTMAGANTFDLFNWNTGNGGVWEKWYVNNGTLGEAPGSAINCFVASMENPPASADFSIYPNPSQGIFSISAPGEPYIMEILLFSLDGKALLIAKDLPAGKADLDISSLDSGVYFITIKTSQRAFTRKIIKCSSER